MRTAPPPRQPLTSLPPPPFPPHAPATAGMHPRGTSHPAGARADRHGHPLPAARATPTRPGPQGGVLDAGRPPARARTSGVAELCLLPVPPLPSALDLDVTLLAAPAARRTDRPSAHRPASHAEADHDETEDRRVERLRTLAFATSVVTLSALSALSLRLAL